MITKKHYLKIAEKYGEFASWAVWEEEGSEPKSNIGDMNIFDLNKNPGLLEILKTDVILVALNFSRSVNNIPFINFHDARPQSQDYKIRYAFRGTRFYGAYMTDIIKDFEEKISANVIAFLKENRKFELKNIELFKEEIAELNCSDPFIIAFGNTTYEILNKHFCNTYRIQKVMHYSQYISKENYKKEVWDTLKIKGN